MLLDIQGDMNAMQKTMNELEKLSDEEKAEEYAEKITYIIKGRTLLSRSEVTQRYSGIIQGVLYGLEEGRKEVREHETTCVNRLHHIEKENAELKKDKEYLDKVNNEQTEVILKLNDQIEKMKCCKNCKHSFSEGMGCMQRARQNWCHNYALWELAE